MAKRRPNKWGMLNRTSPVSDIRRDRLGSRAEKCRVLGRSFASKLEAAVWGILSLEQMAGEISNLRQYENVFLTAARIRMIPDFAYERDGVTCYAEAKGHETDVYRLKYRLWKAGYGPGILRIFKGSYRRPFEAEIIVPKCLEKGER